MTRVDLGVKSVSNAVINIVVILKVLYIVIALVVIFMGPTRAHRLGGRDFKVIIWEASGKEMGPFLWEQLTRPDTMYRF